MGAIISEERKMQLAGLYLLKLMEHETFSLAPEGDESILEPIHKFLFEKEYIAITADNTQWQLEVKGRDLLATFDQKYRDFLKETDIYCSVDLESGEFAFSYYDQFSDNYQWHDFINQERWDDLRIAVAEAKGRDPIEVIFMSFVNDGQFGRTDEGWDYEKLLGSVWDEIAEVANGAIRLKNLAYQDGSELVSGQEVIQDIISQGEELAAKLK